MPAYERPPSDSAYPPQRQSFSTRRPSASALPHAQEPYPQPHPTNPNYNPYMQQQPAAPQDPAPRRPSVPYGPDRPAVAYTTQPPYNAAPSQQASYYPQPAQDTTYRAPTQSPSPRAAHAQPTAAPYPRPPPPPQQQQMPVPEQYLHPSFDAAAYQHGAPRSRSYSGPRPSHSRTSSGGSGGQYRDREKDHRDRERDHHDREYRDRRASSSGSARSRRSSHHSYEDDAGRRHYHREGKRPTYGDSLMMAWDKTREFLSSRRE